MSFGVSSEWSCEVMVDGHFWVKFGADHSEVVVEDWEEEEEVGHFVEEVEVEDYLVEN